MSEELKPDCGCCADLSHGGVSHSGDNIAVYRDMNTSACLYPAALARAKELETLCCDMEAQLMDYVIKAEKAEKERDEWKEKHSDYVKRQACNARAFGSLEAERDALQKQVADLESQLRIRRIDY